MNIDRNLISAQVVPSGHFAKFGKLWHLMIILSPAADHGKDNGQIARKFSLMKTFDHVSRFYMKLALELVPILGADVLCKQSKMIDTLLS